jgi:hypothetical protein
MKKKESKDWRLVTALHEFLKTTPATWAEMFEFINESHPDLRSVDLDRFRQVGGRAFKRHRYEPVTGQHPDNRRIIIFSAGDPPTKEPRLTKKESLPYIGGILKAIKKAANKGITIRMNGQGDMVTARIEGQKERCKFVALHGGKPFEKATLEKGEDGRVDWKLE